MPDFGYAAFTPYGRPFQGSSPVLHFPMSLSYNPARASTRTVWAPPLSLAATRGITVVFSSSGYLDVSVPRVGSTSWCRAFRAAGSPIRTPADLRPFAPPRGFSQLVTSFVASESQGIPRTPFLDFLVSSFNCKRFIRLILGFFLSSSIDPFQNLSLPICLVSPTCQSPRARLPGQLRRQRRSPARTAPSRKGVGG